MKHFLTTLLAASLLLCSACQGKDKNAGSHDADNVLVLVGDSALMLSDVLSRIPYGLEEADSVALFNSIVDGWIQDMLLMDVAQKNIADMSAIDKKVEDYRKSLILAEYKKMIRRGKQRSISDEAVRNYYETHIDELKLQRPIVKGLYIKLPASASQIEDVRREVRSASAAAVDRLEKYGLKGAMQYDYFLNRWVDWQTLSDQIPYRFGDPDRFVANHKDFETQNSSSIWFLHISEYLTSGETMPYDYAAPLIREILEAEQSAQTDRHLFISLYNDAARQQRIKAVNFNPTTHEMKK